MDVLLYRNYPHHHGLISMDPGTVTLLIWGGVRGEQEGYPSSVLFVERIRVRVYILGEPLTSNIRALGGYAVTPSTPNARPPEWGP
jgi:hypothetical protein